MKIFHAAAKLDAGADKKHDINFHLPKALRYSKNNKVLRTEP